MHGHGPVDDLRPYYTVEDALTAIDAIYSESVSRIRNTFDAYATGNHDGSQPDATYPYLGIELAQAQAPKPGRLSYGNLPTAGIFGTSLTRPQLFRSYYAEQISLLLENYGGPVYVGRSQRQIPLTFAVESATAAISAEQVHDLQNIFKMPDLADIDDNIANGTFIAKEGDPLPLSLFSAERVDLSLMRLSHYTATHPEHFQRFVLFTNYQRYVEEFIEYGKTEVANGTEYREFVEPGEVITPNPRLTDIPASGSHPKHMPQMPAYHLVKDKHEGITLVNIGVGPSNAKTITDHLAVLRPHCWLMVGHCGGLRRSQKLGDYALAHAYVRDDHVLDADLPTWVPLPAIAEVQVALTEAVREISQVSAAETKSLLRTGTVYTTDDRDWELRHKEMAVRFNQSRAIAIDMESATIAANGFRLRVPYGTLLCVSDKPMHGEIKLRGMANKFYGERVSQHMKIGIRTVEKLRQQGIESLHSRKLRSFQEPAFR